MWGTFALAVIVAIVFAFIPGYFLLRGLRLCRLASWCLAPLISILLYNVLAVVFVKASVFTTWANLFLPALGLGLVVFALPAATSKGKLFTSPGSSLGIASLSGKKPALTLLLYVVVGAILTGWILVGNLGDPNAYLQEYDNVFHLGTIRGFIMSGGYSVLSAGIYPEGALQPNTIPFFWSDDSSFYPTAWHCLCALLVSSLGVSIPLSINAVNTILLAVVFPSGAFLLLKAIFTYSQRAVVCGCIACLAFTSCLWDFLSFGPLYPNILGLALVPAAMVTFISFFKGQDHPQSPLPLRIALFVAACISMVAAHPNALFTCVVLLAPFLCVTVGHFFKKQFGNGTSKPLFVLGCVVTALVVFGIWMLIYYTPFMQNGPLADWWPHYSGMLEGVIYILTVAYKTPQQLILAAMVIIGALVALVSPKGYRWMIASYVLAAAIFWIGIALGDFIKSVACGFWYTDSHRLAATLALAGVPLAALGLAQVTTGVEIPLGKVFNKGEAAPAAPTPATAPAAPTPATAPAAPAPKTQTLLACLSTALVLVVFSAFNFSPVPIGFLNGQASAFGYIHYANWEGNSTQIDRVYGTDESAFMQKVKAEIPEGALIINSPNDGSAFAVPLDNMNMYYRYLRGYGAASETPQSVLIRTQLSSIASSPQVQQAVASTGARYVLQLDKGYHLGPTSRILFTFEDEALWIGVDSITEETPGFDLVLSEDDMRLYRIQDFS